VTADTQAKSLKTLRQEACEGQVQAQFALGKYYTRLDHAPGQDVGRQQLALKWFLEAAGQGHAGAQNQLGLIYAWGPAPLRNEEAAELWLRKATAQDHAGAWIDLGWLLRRRNAEAATVVRCFEQAVALGNTAGYYNLGILYAYALDAERDVAKLLQVYRDAAQLESAPAQWYLGCGLSEPYSGPTSVHLAEAVQWFRRAAEEGDSAGQYEFGKLHEQGRGVPQELERAAELYRLAAVQGNGMAQNALGRLCRAGLGVAQDFAGALLWFRKAATQDPQLKEIEVTEAQNAMGEMYLRGEGVAQDIPTALQLFKKAAKGNAAACVNLGALYFEGKLVPCNYVEAKQCFRQAALAGNGEAKGWLARLKTIRLRPARKPAASAAKPDGNDQGQLQLGLL
jgi:TPR repeat protein